jgi:hypothetical protein
MATHEPGEFSGRTILRILESWQVRPGGIILFGPVLPIFLRKGGTTADFHTGAAWLIERQFLVPSASLASGYVLTRAGAEAM